MGSGPDFDSFTVAVSDGQVSTPVTVKVAVLPAAYPVDRHDGPDRCNPDGDGGFADEDLCGQSGL